MTLLFWQFFPLPFADQKENLTAQKNVIVVESKKQEPKPTASHKQGVKINREGLRSLLKAAFTQYGIVDLLPMAEVVITCENRDWVVDPLPHNGISWGAAQFTPDTWHDFGHGDIMDPKAQFDAMARMWKAGLEIRWDCYKLNY